MPLNFYYHLQAPASTKQDQLCTFLNQVGEQALDLGFEKAVVINCVFKTTDQLDFARRISILPDFDDDRLCGADFAGDPAVHCQDRQRGTCRVHPVRGTLLVVTDNSGLETTYGFLRFPSEIKGVEDTEGTGETVTVRDPVGPGWQFRQTIQSPDPRYRKLIRRFAEAGYLHESRDEWSVEPDGSPGAKGNPAG